MDDLNYLLGSGCYWKKKAPDMDTNDIVDLNYLFDSHDEEQENILEDLEIVKGEFEDE